MSNDVILCKRLLFRDIDGHKWISKDVFDKLFARLIKNKQWKDIYKDLRRISNYCIEHNNKLY
jgi:hypothetical protein